MAQMFKNNFFEMPMEKNTSRTKATEQVDTHSQALCIALYLYMFYKERYPFNAI